MRITSSPCYNLGTKGAKCWRDTPCRNGNVLVDEKFQKSPRFIRSMVLLSPFQPIKAFTRLNWV
jgi:hypothetical protein